MQLICIKNQSKENPMVLPIDPNLPVSDINSVISTEWYTIDSIISGYSLTPGKKYEVYGLLFINSELRYLLQDDQGLPYFFPCTLFEIIDNSVLADWAVSSFHTLQFRISIISYRDLVNDYDTIIDLLRLSPVSVRAFLDYKTKVIHW